jgi:hypothetical protein
MDKSIIKKKLFDACYNMQKQKAEAIETIMADAQRSASEDDHSKDIFDASREMIINNRDMYALQLQKELDQLAILNRLDINAPYDTAKFGSVVVTDEQKCFIAVALGRISLDGDEYHVISPKVPFFEAIQGAKKGDVVDFRGKKIRIRDVF